MIQIRTGRRFRLCLGMLAIIGLALSLTVVGMAHAGDSEPVCIGTVAPPVCTAAVPYQLLPVCGDGRCDTLETSLTCPSDCPAILPTLIPSKCGDGLCDPTSENSNNCPSDCPVILPTILPDTCGDGRCILPETSLTCPADCPTILPTLGVSKCGDGVCDPLTETSDTCPADCPRIVPVCGDGVCDPLLETELTCYKDCHVIKCGNGLCELPREDSSTCLADCPKPTATTPPPTATRVTSTPRPTRTASPEAPTATAFSTPGLTSTETPDDYGPLIAQLANNPPHVTGAICHVVEPADIDRGVRNAYSKRVGSPADVWIICTGHLEEMCLPAAAAETDAQGSTQFLDCTSEGSCTSFRAEVEGQQACVTAKVLIQPTCREGCAFAPGQLLVAAQDTIPVGLCMGAMLIASFGVWVLMVRRRGLEIDVEEAPVWRFESIDPFE